METAPGTGSAMQQAKDEDEAMRNKKMKVMVAIDDCEESFHALKWTLDNLYGITGVTPESCDGGGILTLVHVQQPFHRYIFSAATGHTGPVSCVSPQAANANKTFYAPSSMEESARKAQEENAEALLSRTLQMCKDKKVKAETLILEGDPKDMICQTAEQMNIDLLVVGSRGLGKIKRAFLGSVSDYCAHHAACPILIVKPPKEQHK